MLSRKRCVRCAELIRKEATACRYCGAENPDVQIAEDTAHRKTPLIVGLVGLSLVLSLGGLAWFLLGQESSMTIGLPRSNVATSPAMLPRLEGLTVGETIEWKASNAPDKIDRQVGPLTISISKHHEDGLVGPTVSVRSGDSTIELVGSSAQDTYTHYVTAVELQKGGPPAIMLRSFSGGAHCCTVVQIGALLNGSLSVVDLGGWDGDVFEKPTDISGDGVVDFVAYDNNFLYAFAPYAMSYSPPKILNIVGKSVVDVSKRGNFRSLFVKSMRESGKVCLSGESGSERNGACATYVASAARVGQLSKAWSDMLVGYDASVDWEFPTGCLQPQKGDCPERLQVHFKSYPEALLFFLKRNGYIDRRWSPPLMQDISPSPSGSDEGESAFPTT